MTLSNKQQVFVEAYLQCWNASEAARVAEYAHPGSQGHRLLKNVEVAEEIQRRVSEISMSADEVLVRLAEHARGNMADFLEFIPGIKHPYANFEQARDRGQLHLIKKFKYNSDGYPEVELYDAQAALVQLGRAHKLFTDKSEVTGEDGGPIIVKGYAVFSPDDWDTDIDDADA